MNKYQKYPLNCSSCNALTPHTLISTFNDDEQSKEKPSAFSFIRALGWLLFRSFLAKFSRLFLLYC